MLKLREMLRSAPEYPSLTLLRREDLPSGGASQPQPTPIPAQRHLRVAELDLWLGYDRPTSRLKQPDNKRNMVSVDFIRSLE